MPRSLLEQLSVGGTRCGVRLPAVNKKDVAVVAHMGLVDVHVYRGATTLQQGHIHSHVYRTESIAPHRRKGLQM